MKLVSQGVPILLLLTSGAFGQLLDLNTIKDLVMTNVMECATENEVHIRDMIIMLQNVVVSTSDVNNSTKCFVFCLMSRFNVMEEDGEFMVDLLKFGAMMIPNEIIKKIVLDNLDPIIKESTITQDPCERAFMFMKVTYKRFVLNPNVQALLTLAKSALGKLSGSIMSRVTRVMSGR